MEWSAHWAKCCFGEIVTLKNGYAFQSADYQEHGVPVIRISNINDEVVDIGDARKILPDPHFDSFVVSSGDILIAMSGATTGKFGIYKGIEKAYQNQRVGNLKLVSEELLSKKFVFFLLSLLKNKIEEAAYGGAQPNISGGQIEAMEIALPPLAEQHRIVAKIEELFSELDQGVASLKTAREQLKVYRQSLLKNAFEGKLTAAWRAAHADQLETATALQQRIVRERQARYQQQLADWQTAGQAGPKPKPPKPLPPLTAEELAELPELPAGWVWLRLGCALDAVSGNTPKGIEQTSGKEVPFYRVSDMNREGNELYMDSSATYLSKAEAKGLGLAIYPAGTILFPKRGGAIATNKKRRLLVPACFDLNLMGLTNLPNGIGPDYLWNWVLSLDLASISDGSNVPQINNRNVEPLAFPVCSLAEQLEIVQELESKLSEADQLDQTLATALQQADALRQSILKKAFCGQLVAQDPNDEPSTALLERIRAARGTEKPARRGRSAGSQS